MRVKQATAGYFSYSMITKPCAFTAVITCQCQAQTADIMNLSASVRFPGSGAKLKSRGYSFQTVSIGYTRA